MKLSFEEWQQAEYRLLGVTQEEHQKIIDHCIDIGFAFQGGAVEIYEALKGLVLNEQMKALINSLNEIDFNHSGSPDRLICNCGKSQYPGRHHRKGCLLKR